MLLRRETESNRRWILSMLALVLAGSHVAANGQSAASNDLSISHVRDGSLSSKGASRNLFGYDPTPDFIAFDPQYRQKHAKYAHELRELQLELARQAAQGRATPCSRQIFLEARWLVFYSARWEQIEDRLRALGEMLDRPADPAEAREQIESDGSFDHCSQAW